MRTPKEKMPPHRYTLPPTAAMRGDAAPPYPLLPTGEVWRGGTPCSRATSVAKNRSGDPVAGRNAELLRRTGRHFEHRPNLSA